MRIRSLLPLIALLISAPQAFAQNAAITEARITWFGIYTVAKSSAIGAEQGPVVKQGGIIPPTTNSDQIVLGRGIRFGFGYMLTGSSGNGRVQAYFWYPPPGVFDPRFGNTVKAFAQMTECEIGASDCLVGFAVDDPKELPTGAWKFQVYDQAATKLLAEKIFTVRLRAP